MLIGHCQSKVHRTFYLISAIEALCKCPLSSASQQHLARQIVLGGQGSISQGNSLLGYLKSEVHVGTMCVGVGVLVRWCEVIAGGEDVPLALIDHLKVQV